MKKIKLALIGVGHLGQLHLKTFLKLKNKVELIGLCDIDPTLNSLAKEHGLPFFNDHAALLGKVDAVSICTPTSSHFAIGNFFLDNGVHAFIEKPISSSIPEAEKLILTSRFKNTKLQIGHVERFNCAFEAAKILVKDPRFIECHRLSSFPKRSLDIGVVMDLMIHDIDIIQGLVGPCPKHIDAIGINVLTQKDDIANARLTYMTQWDKECVCNLTASRVSPEAMRRIRIFLPHAYIALDYLKQEAFLCKKEGDTILREAIPIEKNEPLKKELEHFIDCILNDTTPLVGGEEGRDALRTALSIQEAIWTRNAANS